MIKHCLFANFKEASSIFASFMSVFSKIMNRADKSLQMHMFLAKYVNTNFLFTYLFFFIYLFNKFYSA